MLLKLSWATNRAETWVFAVPWNLELFVKERNTLPSCKFLTFINLFAFPETQPPAFQRQNKNIIEKRFNALEMSRRTMSINQ